MKRSGGIATPRRKWRSEEFTFAQKKRASTSVVLAGSEFEAAETLVAKGLRREAIGHYYLASYYAARAVLAARLPARAGHQRVAVELGRVFRAEAPGIRRFARIHGELRKLKQRFEGREAYTPSRSLIRSLSRSVGRFLDFVLRKIPQVSSEDVLRGILKDNPEDVRDFSYDVYCPKTYTHHTRLTVWQRPFYLQLFPLEVLAGNAKEMLRKLRIRRWRDYVLGLNSRLDQYKGTHLIMLDIDSLDEEVESALRGIGGILLKSGRGFHFIGRSILRGQKRWETQLRRLARSRGLRKHVDWKHVDISLKRGYSTLRLTTSRVKPTAPAFFKEL